MSRPEQNGYFAPGGFEMKTTIRLSEGGLKTGAFTLFLEVTNDGTEEQSFPLGRLQTNAELSALRLQDADGQTIEPLEYTLVNPRGIPADHTLAAGDSVRFELNGNLEEKLPGIVALSFPRATYRLLRGERYSVSLCWGDLLESHSIEFCVQS